MARVLLLNDTDENGNHFGCQQVMRTIRTELAKRGLTELESILVGTDWRRDQSARALIDAADLVVINGEGTLHHAKRKAKWLLDAGVRAKGRGAKVALVNALWQSNPRSWAELAAGFDVLWCRDSRSAASLAADTGREVICTGDLSMLHVAPNLDRVRSGKMASCSVYHNVTDHLASLAEQIGAEFVPVTKEIRPPSHQWRGLKRLWRTMTARREAARFIQRHPETRLVGSVDSYLEELLSHELLITGRFHGVCLAILTQTPFLAVSSNSWKIETLLSDIGLDDARVQSLTRITSELVNSRDWSFSPSELNQIETRLLNWRTTASLAFDEIVALTH